MSKFNLVKEQWKQKQEVQTRHYMDQKRQRAEEIAEIKRTMDALSKNGKPTKKVKQQKAQMIQHVQRPRCQHFGYIGTSTAANSLMMSHKALVNYCRTGCVPGAVKKRFQRDDDNKLGSPTYLQWCIPNEEFDKMLANAKQGKPIIDNVKEKMEAHRNK